MIFGFPFSVPFGAHDDFITVPRASVVNGGAKVQFEPLMNYSQYYSPVFDGQQSPTPSYCVSNIPQTFSGLLNPLTTKHAVSIAPLGDWGSGSFDVTIQQMVFEALRGNRLNITCQGTPAYIAYQTNIGTITQLTNWNLTGVDRFNTSRPVLGRPTYAQLDLTLSNSGSTRTVVLALNGVIQSTGSITGNGTITMTGLITGTVDIVYTADVLTNGFLVVDFPQQYNIYFSQTMFTSMTFPAQPNGKIRDDGQEDSYTFISDIVDAGTWYVTVRQVDSESKESTNIDNIPIISFTPPANPGTPFYAAGNWANTNLKAKASTTSGATYFVYDSGVDGPLTLQSDTPAVTMGTQTGIFNIVLPPLTDPLFTGQRAILLHSVKAGIESANVDILTIEYLNGNVVLPRPNSPASTNRVKVNGRALTANYSYSTVNQAVAPASVAIFIYAVGSTPNYASPQGTASTQAAFGASISGSVTGTVSSDGIYYYEVRAVSALGMQDTGTVVYGPLELSNATPPAPASTSVGLGFS